MIRIISHNDLDGYGCTIVAKKFFGEENVKASNVTNMSEDQYIEFFQKEIKTWDEYDMIFITDLSLPGHVIDMLTSYKKERMTPILQSANVPTLEKPYPVYYCDHHKTTDPSEYYRGSYSQWIKVDARDRLGK